MSLLNSLTIRKQLYSVFALFILIPVFFVTFVLFVFFYDVTIERTYLRLETLLDLKANKIAYWAKQGEQATNLASEIGTDLIDVQRLNELTVSNFDIGDRFKKRLKQIAKTYSSVKSISILHPKSGKVIHSTDMLYLGRIRENEAYFKNGKTGLFRGQISYSVGREEPLLNISAPVVTTRGKLIAVIVVEMELSDLDRLISNQDFLFHSEKTFTVDKFGFYVTLPDKEKIYPLQMADQNEITKSLLNGKSGRANFENRSGNRVISVYKWLEETDLGLFIEIDLKEAIYPISRLKTVFLVVVSVILLSNLLVLFFISKIIINPIKQVAETANFLQKGDLSRRANLNGPPESRALADSFNEMASTIQQTQQKLNDTVSDLRNEIEERKQIEIQLKNANEEAELANSAKSEFLANISHELRNPMHHILSYSKYGIDKAFKIPEEKKSFYFKQIRKSADRLMILLNDLLDLSKFEAGKMVFDFQVNDINLIVNEAIKESRIFADRKGVKIRNRSDYLLARTTCDGFKIGQVVRNLLSNAIQYSNSRQTVDLKIDQFESTSLFPGSPAIQVSVIDRGVGIPEGELNTIFEKFVQSSKTKTGAGGTGLGLAICFEIIKAHKGRIWAEHNPEGGSIFKFALQVSPF